MVNREKVQLTFFFLFFAAVTALTAYLFLPFFEVLALAAIFAVVLSPIHRRVLKVLRGRAGFAAAATVLLTLVFVVIPVSFVGVQVFNEAGDVYGGLRNGGDYVTRVVQAIETPIQGVIPSFTINVAGYGEAFFDWLAGHLGPFLSGTAYVIFGFLLMLVALFFFLRDGKRFLDFLLTVSPLDDTYDDEIVHRVGATVHAVVRGALLVSIVQGILAGVGMALFGVPNAVLWGTLAAIAAIIPGLGTGLVLIPAVLYLFMQGGFAAPLGLMAWGIAVVGLVDNILMPYLYSRGVPVHPLVILFAVLGGLATFGPLGFLIGPIVVSLFIAVFDIYQKFTEEKHATV